VPILGVILWLLRRRKKLPHQKIGILNKGKNNRFINNTFKNLDIGIKDEGEDTKAKGNKFS